MAPTESKAASLGARPPGPPPDRKPPGPPPKARAKEKAKAAPAEAEGGKPAPAPQTVADLPSGAKAPPPPPKKASAGLAKAKAALKAATLFTPTALRSKKPSQVAGGVVQVSSASLSQEARKRVLFTEKPTVAERVDMDEAFGQFMAELDDED
uniref:Uncharacterized protein n=1 Tax=Alexandrium catenella TaxID=2925 RepID=A0A7S1RCD8_ALECA|mmetsp:Transcript_50942/g.136270  ORF Transcript_50942/g.136270 Transcript_50942/m.136270 type:complete len:153 (+) Transcript_50942:1-459(+)